LRDPRLFTNTTELRATPDGLPLAGTDLKRHVAPCNLALSGCKLGLKLAKIAIFERILGLICASKSVRFGHFSKDQTFVFNEIVASLVSKNNLFFFSLAFPFRQAFRLPLMRRLVPTPGSK
jgi:hypothetical protein